MEAKRVPDWLMEDELVFDDEEGRVEFLEMLERTVLQSDEARIDWLLEQIAEHEALIARNDAVADARIQMQEDFRQGENAKLERRIKWRRQEIAKLVPQSGEAMEKEYKAKSRRLAHGSFGYKKRPDRVEIEDTDAALLYAAENKLPIDERLVRTIKKDVLKAHATETGVVEGDGWKLVPGDDEFFVKAAS